MDALPVFDLAEYLAKREPAAPTPATAPNNVPSCHDILTNSFTDRQRHDDGSVSESQAATCRAMAECFRTAGVVVVRDPRCSEAHNERFLDTMERYYELPVEKKMRHVRRDLHYQVGSTPEGVELPQCLSNKAMLAHIASLPSTSKPTMPDGPDRKWRYFWRVGPRPASTNFPELNADPVIPEGFTDWSEVMDEWGSKMLAALEVVAEMTAIGLGLPQHAFTSLMKEGPHLLAPTGSDLARHASLSNGASPVVLAGFHSDLNFLTIHGRSRFPGLFIWLRDGTRAPVSVPQGCLLVQAGMQMEWLTGGAVRAGMHEVVVTDATRAAVEKAKAEGRSLWRVSSTAFGHINSDRILEPLGHLVKLPEARNYPPILTGDFVEAELSKINLLAPSPHGSNGATMTHAPESSEVVAVA